MKKILFIDVETVPEYRNLDQVPSNKLDLFLKRFDAELQKSDVSAHELYDQKGGLYAEFGKIVCISIGYVIKKGEAEEIAIKSLCGRHEKLILEGFIKIVDRKPDAYLCAHNGIEFDYPFLLRRLMVNGLPIPGVLDTMETKPWDLKLLDTMAMWGGTQWKYRASLDLLCELFGIDSPKGDLDGSKVGSLYYSMFNIEDDSLPFDKETEVLGRISEYCNCDVIAMINVYYKLKGMNPPKKMSSYE
jgi:hypothetical protein